MKHLPVGLLLLVCHFFSEAATRTGIVGGTIASPLTGTAAWDCTCIPTQNDDIVVPDGSNVELAGNFTVNNGSITLNGTSSLTIDGNATFNNGSTVTVGASGTLIVNGDLLNRNNSSNITFNGTVDVNGTLTNNGNGSVITVGSGASIEADDFVNGSMANFNVTEPITMVINNTCTNNGTVTDTSGSYSGCGQGVLNEALPVTLGDFSATVLISAVLLEWHTLTEENFEYFSIQRSQDLENWIEIGQEMGNGDSKVRIDYSYEDSEVTPGLWYYRLQSFDFDGYTEIFNAISVFIDFDSQITTHQTVINGGTLNVLQSKNSFLGIKLYDLSGQEYLKTSSLQNRMVNVPYSIPNGVYILEIQGNLSLSRNRIVILR